MCQWIVRMNKIIHHFFWIGPLRFIARVVMGFRGLVIIVSLSPAVLGEYTVWLLFAFYFSMCDLGVLNALERDLPHYRGKKDLEKSYSVANIGWSSYFVLSFVSSVLLCIVSYIILGELVLSVLVGLYLLSDKIFRAYDTDSRIRFLFLDNGIAQFILAVSSLGVIWILLPVFGILGIFIGFILASFASIYFLSRKFRLEFHWHFNIVDAFKVVKTSIPLAILIYSMELFHAIALTLIAIRCDKATLGYSVFAIRLFQICLGIFPYLIQEVMRARMYYKIAQTEEREKHLQHLLSPMMTYGLITSIFWLFIYWWADWGIFRFSPTYINTVWAVKLLTLSLLPLGILKICSDFLCSRVYNKTRFVVLSWILGIVLQVTLLSVGVLDFQNILIKLATTYLASTLLVYILIVGESFQVKGYALKSLSRILLLFFPFLISCMVVYLPKNFFQYAPSRDFLNNVLPFIYSVFVTLLVGVGFIWIFRQNKILRV
jgi:hypothetical protein